MKKMMLLVLVLCLAGFSQADLLTDNGVASGFETSHDDGFGSQISDGFAVWTNWDNWGNVDHETEYTSNTSITANTGDGYWLLSGGGNTPCVGSALVPATAGLEYTFGVWIKAEDGNAPTTVEIGFDFVFTGDCLL